MNGALTADAASSENCCGSQTSAEQAGSKSTCTSGGCGKECGKTSGDSGAHQIEASPATGGSDYTYASTQATKCARCGQYKHTPLRVDKMDGYVCLTCIDVELERLLDEEADRNAGALAYAELSAAWLAYDGSPGTAKRVNLALGMLGVAIASADPCPQCERGGVCRTVECGRKRSSELMRLYGTDGGQA
jgi:hypothetical protein